MPRIICVCLTLWFSCGVMPSAVSALTITDIRTLDQPDGAPYSVLHMLSLPERPLIHAYTSVNWVDDVSVLQPVAFFLVVTDATVGTADLSVSWSGRVVKRTHESLLTYPGGDGLYGFGITAPLNECCYTPLDAVLGITITGMETREVPFAIVQPVPEPASLCLLGTGLVGVVRKRR